MRVLTVFAALGLAFGGLSLLFADRTDAAYSDGGPIVLGNFSQGAYGSGDHRDAPREEPRRSVRTAALAPTAYAPKATTTAPKSVTAPRKEEEGPPPAPPPRGLSDEQEQALLIEKSLIAVAYAKRKQEANPLWTCLHESGKQLLAHIEAEFGPVDISEGTCVKRSIAGTATLSQHAYTIAEASLNVCVGPRSGPELTRVERHEVIGPGVYMNVTHRGVGHDATDPSLVAMGHEPRYYLLFAVPLAGKKVDGASGPLSGVMQTCRVHVQLVCL
jgi:hypothetical protein